MVARRYRFVEHLARWVWGLRIDHTLGESEGLNTSSETPELYYLIFLSVHQSAAQHWLNMLICGGTTVLDAEKSSNAKVKQNEEGPTVSLGTTIDTECYVSLSCQRFFLRRNSK